MLQVYTLGVCIGRMLWACALGVGVGRVFWAYVLGVCFGRLIWGYVLGVSFGRMDFPEETRSKVLNRQSQSGLELIVMGDCF